MYVVDGGGKIQIRHNLFVNNNERGLYCPDCPRALIRDNRAEGNGGVGMDLNADRTQVAGNLSAANGGTGILLNPGAGSSHAKVNDNVANRNLFVGINARVNNGRIQVEGNIANENTTYGTLVSPQNGIYASRMRRNLSVANDIHGFLLTSADNLRAENNISLANGSDGYLIASTSSPGLVKNNAAIGNGDCGFEVLDHPLTIDRFFAVSNDDGRTCDTFPGEAIETGPTPSKPPALGIRRAARVVGG